MRGFKVSSSHQTLSPKVNKTDRMQDFKLKIKDPKLNVASESAPTQALLGHRKSASIMTIPNPRFAQVLLSTPWVAAAPVNDDMGGAKRKQPFEYKAAAVAKNNQGKAIASH